MKTIQDLIKTLELAGIEVAKENGRERLHYYPRPDGKVWDCYYFAIKDLDFSIEVLETEPAPKEFEIEFKDYCDYETFEAQWEEVETFLIDLLKDFPVHIYF